MIAPDMATMLSFVVTDAPIARAVLQALLSDGVDKTFNAVTVDSDTSTSDTLLLFATGAAAKRGAPGSRGRAIRASPPSARRSRGADDRWRCRWCATARARASWSRSRSTGAEVGALGQAHRAVDRQFAAGQDGGRRRGRQLGPRRHGGRQGRRAGRPRPAGDLVRRHPRRAQGRARPGL